jgi:hypothetical protein
MSIIWLAILIVCGIVRGFGSIDGLFWLLLVPLVMQDMYDGYKRKAHANPNGRHAAARIVKKERE